MKTKWVYKVESIQPPVFAKPSTRRDFINEVLNRRGLEGWELINAPTIVQTSVMQFYFKRPF